MVNKEGKIHMSIKGGIGAMMILLDVFCSLDEE